MTEHQIQEIESFRKWVKSFNGLWQYLVIRVGWARIQEIDMVVFLSAWLETRRPISQAPKYTPACEGFETISVDLPIGHLDALLDGLKEGVLKIDSKEFKLGFFRGQDWVDHFSYHFHKEPGGLSRSGTSQLPFAHLQASESSLFQSTRGVLDHPVLQDKWKCLLKPFKSSIDVLTNYFEAKDAWSNIGSFRFIRAEVPIGIVAAEFDEEAMKLLLTAAETADLDQVSLGRIIRYENGTIMRDTIVPAPEEWRLEDGRRLCTLTWASQGITGIYLNLRYDAVILEERDLINPASYKKNLAMAAHSVIDTKLNLWKTMLKGEGKSGNFENAVGWLFSFSGLSSIVYGPIAKMSDAVDVLVVSRRHGVVLGIECTSGQPEIKDKIARVLQRCQEIQRSLGSRYKVLPVLATPLRSDDIKKPALAGAGQSGVALLTKEKLEELVEATANRKPERFILKSVFDAIPSSETLNTERLFGISPLSPDDVGDPI
ncbi:MAG: hypothetical protein HYT79_10230 [Elusimicrobia bacterium]|nr:hypothetical protein [Elusimicrobiota bacterium]